MILPLAWTRMSRSKWRAAGFEIRAVQLRNEISYRSLAMPPGRRAFFGIADAWHVTAAAARDWCEIKASRE